MIEFGKEPTIKNNKGLIPKKKYLQFFGATVLTKNTQLLCRLPLDALFPVRLATLCRGDLLW